MAYNATQPCDDRPHRMGAHLDGLASPTPKQSEFPGADQYWFWVKALDEPRFVYVVQGLPGTPIKVGKAKDPLSRLATLQTGNPEKLHLLYVMPGYHEEETALHHKLHEAFVGGEWFAGPKVEEFLAWFDRLSREAVEAYKRGEEVRWIPVTTRKRRSKAPTPRPRKRVERMHA